MFVHLYVCHSLKFGVSLTISIGISNSFWLKASTKLLFLVVLCSNWMSILGPNGVIAKDVISCTYCLLLLWEDAQHQWYDKGECLGISLPCTVRTSWQRSCNQRVCWLGSRAFNSSKLFAHCYYQLSSEVWIVWILL